MAWSTEGTSIHGTLVRVDGEGILFCGKAGMGKSTIAFELLTAGHQLVADDVVLVRRAGSGLIGTAPTRLKGVLSIPEIGIFDVRNVLGPQSFAESSRIDRCVELVSDENEQLDSPKELLGIDLTKTFRRVDIEDSHTQSLLDIDREAIRRCEIKILREHDRLVGSAS